ncbi:MAG: DUF2267 domain-containing protein [Desulfuromonadales bacterium]|nr:DUF2267 domain-containing protein [Desulfuromonadales bacterium]
MKADEFIKQVKERAHLDSRDQALEATRATLCVLGERLFGGERNDLAAQLPPELQPFLLEPMESESFDLKEFFERVGEEEGIGTAQAQQHATAVISVLCDAVTRGEIEDVKSQLPKDFAALFEGTRH